MHTMNTCTHTHTGPHTHMHIHTQIHSHYIYPECIILRQDIEKSIYLSLLSWMVQLESWFIFVLSEANIDAGPKVTSLHNNTTLCGKEERVEGE